MYFHFISHIITPINHMYFQFISHIITPNIHVPCNQITLNYIAKPAMLCGVSSSTI